MYAVRGRRCFSRTRGAGLLRTRFPVEKEIGVAILGAVYKQEITSNSSPKRKYEAERFSGAEAMLGAI